MSATGLESMKWQPAQDLTLLITRALGRDIRRRHTIAGQDHDKTCLDVYLHGQGIGTPCARALQPGDTVSGIGPHGKFLLNPNADWMVLIGDETSLSGIHAMLAATDPAAQVIVEVDDHAEWHTSAPARASISSEHGSLENLRSTCTPRWRCPRLVRATRTYPDKPDGCGPGATN
jgi:NADPH-dependent ferric siderophore reductase